VIGSVFLLALWAIIYIAAIYKHPYVYLGSGPAEPESIRGSRYSNYMDEEKGGFILSECFWCLIEGGLYIYFVFVTKKFADTYWPEEGDEEKEKEEKMEEEKKEEPPKDDKK